MRVVTRVASVNLLKNACSAPTEAGAKRTLHTLAVDRSAGVLSSPKGGLGVVAPTLDGIAPKSVAVQAIMPLVFHTRRCFSPATSSTSRARLPHTAWRFRWPVRCSRSP